MSSLENKPAQAYSTRREAVTEYNICENKRDVLEKVICMTELRNRLSRNPLDSYDIYELTKKLEEYSEQKLKSIYRKERQLVQQSIAGLSND